MTPLLIAHEAACALLFFSVFCRLTKTHHGTLLGIRFAFFVLGVVAAIGMACPILGWPLSWFGVLLSLSIVLVQLVTSHYWAGGVPGQFWKDARHDSRRNHPHRHQPGAGHAARPHGQPAGPRDAAGNRPAGKPL